MSVDSMMISLEWICPLFPMFCDVSMLVFPRRRCHLIILGKLKPHQGDIYLPAVLYGNMKVMGRIPDRYRKSNMADSMRVSKPETAR